MFTELQLPPRPPMSDEHYLEAVHRAGVALNEARPWLLVQYPNGPWLVAKRRTALMRLVVALVNVWRRPRRWWLDRLRAAYFQRQSHGNRNNQP